MKKLSSKPGRRQRIYDKYEGRCAYCGQKIDFWDMQVDHFVPVYREWSDETLSEMGLVRGTDDEDNLMPSCRMCNFRKGTMDIEAFRKEIELTLDRKVVFHYEEYNNPKCNKEDIL